MFDLSLSELSLRASLRRDAIAADLTLHTLCARDLTDPSRPHLATSDPDAAPRVGARAAAERAAAPPEPARPLSAMRSPSGGGPSSVPGSGSISGLISGAEDGPSDGPSGEALVRIGYTRSRGAQPGPAEVRRRIISSGD